MLKQPDQHRDDSNFLILFLQFLYTIVNYLLSTSQRISHYSPHPSTTPHANNLSIKELTKWIEGDKPKESRTKNDNSVIKKPVIKKQITVSRPIANKNLQKLQQPQIQTKSVSDDSENQNSNKPIYQKKNTTNIPIKKTRKINKSSNQRHQTSSRNKHNKSEGFTISSDFESDYNYKKTGRHNKSSGNFSINILPNELILYILQYLDKKSKLSIREAAKRFQNLITINDNANSFFKPINKYDFLFQLLNDIKENALIESHPDLKLFGSLQTLPHNFQQNIQSYLDKLTKKYHPTNNNLSHNSREQQLLRFYRTLTDSNRKNIDPNKLNEAIKDFRYFLYESKKLQYKIVFHVEQSNSLESAIKYWEPKDGNTKNKVNFSVSPHDTFFEKIEKIGVSVLKPSTIISILIIPNTQFSIEGNYNQKTDYERTYEIMTPNTARAKLKQTHIGNCIYTIDPEYRVVTWVIGNRNDLKKYVINAKRLLGIDIAITNDTKIKLEDYIDTYLETLKIQILNDNEYTFSH